MKKFILIFLAAWQVATSFAQSAAKNQWYLGFGTAAYSSVFSDTLVTRYPQGKGVASTQYRDGQSAFSPSIGYGRRLSSRWAVDVSLSYQRHKGRLNEGAMIEFSPDIAIDRSSPYQNWAVWSDLQVKYLLTPRWGPKLRAGTGISASWRVNAYQSYYEIEVDDGLTSYSELNIHTIRQRSFSYGVPLSIGLDFPLPGPWFVGVEARGAFFFNLDDALSASVRVGRYF